MNPAPPIPTLAWLPALLALLAGAWLAYRGWRGRKVSDHASCRRCGFDLHGKPPDSLFCPECGRLLSLPNAVRRGVYERRRAPLTAGVALVLLAAAWLGAAAWVLGRGVDLNPHKPTWLLAREADSANSYVRGAALATLIARIDAGALSAADVARLTDRALALQADRSKEWVPLWGDLFISAAAAGNVPPDKLQRFADNAADLTLEVRPRVRRGDRVLPFRVVIGQGRADAPRVRFGSRVRVTADFGEPRIDGRGDLRGGRLSDVPVDFSRAGRHLSSQVRLTDRITLPLDHGPPTLRVPVEVTVTLLPGLPPSRPKRTDLEATWELLPPDRPTVRLVKDPSRDELMRRCVRLDQVESDADNEFLSVWPSVASPPLGVAFDVYVRDGGEERKVGALAWPGGANHEYHALIRSHWNHFDARTVDVVFRPSAEAAEATTDVFEIWDGGDIVLRDVPVHAGSRVGQSASSPRAFHERVQSTVRRAHPWHGGSRSVARGCNSCGRCEAQRRCRGAKVDVTT